MKSFNQHQPHPFHLVEPSPWPLGISVALLVTTVGAVMKFQGYSDGNLLSIGLIGIILSMGLWWRDCIRESTYEGSHTSPVQRGMMIGFILFLLSEVLFFFSIFWGYFHSSLAPSVELGSMWPPKGIEALNPWEVPLLNTVILLSSGGTVTWAHHALISKNRRDSIIGLTMTVVLAIVFTMLQGYEYYNAPFTISDGVYGSCFYFGTGFHGIHVLVGTIFLIVGLWRVITYQSTNHHHIGLESGIIYWHFVDIVWLFLFVSIYWWGS